VSYWTGPGRGWLAELDLPAASRQIVTDCLAVIDGLAPVIERLDGELHQYPKADPRVKVLRMLPGVGEFTALSQVSGSPIGSHPGPDRRRQRPFGIQVIARRWHDEQLLAAAEAIAAVTGGVRAPPGP
jgi:Asp-tRNA(Asn)/Glu-tRNA(Gln) amidotransferase A subunit family amidase